MTAKLPDFLLGHWTTPEGLEMAKRYAAMRRMELMAQNMTDMEVANAVFLEPSIMNLTVAKDRIRWLSVHLAMADEKAAEGSIYTREYAKAVEAAAVFQNGGPLYHLLRLGDSTLIDGPPAAAKRIAELEAALKEVVDQVDRNDGEGIATWADCFDTAREVLAKAGGK